MKQEITDPYGQGHMAYHDGYRLSDNPYKRYSEEWQEWRDGWNDEKREDPYWERIRRIHKKTRK